MTRLKINKYRFAQPHQVQSTNEEITDLNLNHGNFTELNDRAGVGTEQSAVNWSRLCCRGVDLI